MRRFSACLHLSLTLPCSLLLLAGWFAASHRRALPVPQPTAGTPQTINANYGRLPLSFEANQGQAEETVKFLARSGNGTLALGATEAVLALPSANLRLKLAEANPHPRLSGVEPLPGRVNYLRGRDPQKWQTEVPTYAKVRYTAVYPGVDWVFYGNQQQLEYDFIVAPGADPRAIRLQFADVRGVQLNDEGELILQTSGGPVRQMRPRIYQDIAGTRREVAGGYELRGAQEVGFTVGVYDRSQPLVIDPVLVFAARTLPGLKLAVDAQENVYLMSQVSTQNAALEYHNQDIVVTKLNAAGTQQLYATVLGGVDTDLPNDLAVDATGNVYVTGQTYSTDFPGTAPGAPAGVGNGLFFKSSDGAQTWTESNRGMLVQDVYLHSIIFDPANPAVMYAGDQARGPHLFKSTNGGAQWAAIGGGLGTGSRGFTLPLAIVPGNPNALYVATLRGLQKSTDGGATWAETSLRVPNIGSLVYARDNPSVLYAATAYRGGFSDPTTIYKSMDGGQQWNLAAEGLPPNLVGGRVVADPFAAATLYVQAGEKGSVYRTTDGGAHWTPLPLNFLTDVLRLRTFAVDPVNAGTLYIGAEFGLYKSTNGGQTWQFVGLKDVHVEALVVDPRNPATLYASTPFICCEGTPSRPLGGVQRSLDGGLTWQTFDNSLKPFMLQSLALNPQNSVLYAGVPGDAEGFALKLNAGGNSLGYATYLRASGVALALDANGNAYVTGFNKRYFAPGERQVYPGEGSVLRVNAQGQITLVYTLPGVGRAIAVERSGNLTVLGQNTGVEPLTVKNGFQSEPGSNFLVRLDPRQSGTTVLLYSTYLGGEFRGMAVDANGASFVALAPKSGETLARKGNVPLQAFGGSFYLTKIDPTKNGADSQLWATYFGTGVVNGLATDANGNLYVTGTTDRADFPITPGAYQTSLAPGVCGQRVICNSTPQCCAFPQMGGCPPNPSTIENIPCNDAFLAKVQPDGAALLYATYFGGSNTAETGDALAVSLAGNVYLSGTGTVPVSAGAFQLPAATGFVTKLSLPARLTALTTLSAASFVGTTLAPAALAVGFLDGVGAGSDKLQVHVKDSAGVARQAEVLFSRNGQVNFLIPAETALGNATINITSNGATIASGTIQIATVAPGVFTANANGRDVPAAVILRVRADGSSVYEPLARLDPATNRFVPAPIDLGPEGEQVILVLFGTGWRGRSAEQNVSVSVGGVAVPLLYAGAQPTLAGLDQINARLPRALAGRGEVDVVVTVDGKTANTVRVAVK